MAVAELEQMTVCPHCGRTNDQHTNMTGSRILRSGDMSVCWGCARLAIYVSGPFGVSLRAPTDGEAAELAADPDLCRLLSAMRAVGRRG